MSNRLYDDYEDYEDSGLTVGCGSGCGEYFSNPIGFEKEVPAPFRLPFRVVYEARGNNVDVAIYTTINGTTYQLQAINKQARAHLARNLYNTLGAKHYEQH